MTFDIEEQVGGHGAIEFFLLEEVANWPAVVTDGNAGTITLTPSPNDVDGTIQPDSIDIKDTPKTGDNGQLWPITISFTFLSRNAAMEQLLEQYANKPGVAISCHNDGSRKLYGTNDQPLYMTFAPDYGDTMESNHGLKIIITGDMRQRPSYYVRPALGTGIAAN